MKPIISYVSELELAREFVKDVRTRDMNQKFFYLDQSAAENYYITAHKDRDHFINKFSGKEYYDFLKTHIDPIKNNILVSLGCGNSEPEKSLLELMVGDSYKVDYAGVDISQPMLEMAEGELKMINIPKKFVRADFSEDEFITEMELLTRGYDTRTIGFWGGTLGNVNQTNIADVLFNILKPGDLLWVEVVTRPDTTLETDMKLFNQYTGYLNDKDEVEFFFSPLKKIRVPFSSGKLNLKTTKERSVGALLFTFYFTFTQKVVLNIDDEIIHILPEEEIKLFDIRFYQPDTLINFFTEHGFTLVSRQQKNIWEQILFKK